MSTAQKILLLEKDEALRASLAEQLELNGEFSCVQEMDSDIALVLLAISQGEDADAASAQLRDRGVKAPILLLGDAGSDLADDFMSKPFRIAHLLSAMRAPSRGRGPGSLRPVPAWS